MARVLDTFRARPEVSTSTRRHLEGCDTPSGRATVCQPGGPTRAGRREHRKEVHRMGLGRSTSDELLTASQVAEEFGVSKTTVYKWGRERRLDVHMLGDGKIWRTTRASVDGLRNGTKRAALTRSDGRV